MSSVKKKINENINFREVFDRLKLIYNFNYDKELAQLFEISPESLINKKKTGTLLPEIVIAGINKNVSLDWLLTGEGEPYSKEIAVKKKEGREILGVVEDELALIRTLRLAGDEYKKMICHTAAVKVQRLIEERKLETKEKLTVFKDLEVLLSTAIK